MHTEHPALLPADYGKADMQRQRLHPAVQQRYLHKRPCCQLRNSHMCVQMHQADVPDLAGRACQCAARIYHAFSVLELSILCEVPALT